MQYTSLSINGSPTIAMMAAAELKNARCLAVKFDENGKGVLCGAGENAVGILLADTDEAIPADGQMNVQIKEIGRWVAGGKVAAGDELTSDASGKCVKAAAGNFITAIAMTAAAAAGDIIQVQIVKAGYVPAAAAGAEDSE